jgi:hypothetical protein
MEFTVCTSSSYQGKVTLVSPKYNIGSLNLTFVWMPVTGCTQYRLKMAKANLPNELIFEALYDVEDVFSNSDQVCSIEPDPALDLEQDTYHR